jgi:hypothetical protein
MRHLRVEAKSCIVCNGLDDGMDGRGKCNKACSRYGAELTAVDRHIYVAGVPRKPTATAQVYDRR